MDKWLSIIVALVGLFVPFFANDFTNKLKFEKYVINNWYQRNFSFILISFIYILNGYLSALKMLENQKVDSSILLLAVIFWSSIYIYLYSLYFKIRMVDDYNAFFYYEKTKYQIIYVNKALNIAYLKDTENTVNIDYDIFISIDNLSSYPIIYEKKLEPISLENLKLITKDNYNNFKKYMIFAGLHLLFLICIFLLILMMLLKGKLSVEFTPCIFVPILICKLYYMFAYSEIHYNKYKNEYQQLQKEATISNNE